MKRDFQNGCFFINYYDVKLLQHKSKATFVVAIQLNFVYQKNALVHVQS